MFAYVVCISPIYLSFIYIDKTPLRICNDFTYHFTTHTHKLHVHTLAKMNNVYIYMVTMYASSTIIPNVP